MWGVIVEIPEDQRSLLDKADGIGQGYEYRDVTVYVARVVDDDGIVTMINHRRLRIPHPTTGEIQYLRHAHPLARTRRSGSNPSRLMALLLGRLVTAQVRSGSQGCLGQPGKSLPRWLATQSHMSMCLR